MALQLAAHQQDPLIHPDANEGIGHLQAVEETAALLPDVVTCTRLVRDPQLVLQKDRGARKVDVWRQRGQDDAVDGALRLAGVGQGRLRCAQSEVAARDVLVPRHVTPLADPRELLDRLRRNVGLDLVTKLVPVVEIGKLRVGHHPLRNVRSHTEDSRSDHDVTSSRSRDEHVRPQAIASRQYAPTSLGWAESKRRSLCLRPIRRS